MTLTDLLIPTYRNMLRTLRGLLDKAETQLGAEKAEALLAARLAPDMFPLATQVRFAVLQVFDGVRHLRREPWTTELDEIVAEGRNAAERPGTLAEARARIDQALAHVDALGEKALDEEPEDASLVLELPDGRKFDLTRDQFARDWALGQFYFHVMAGYAILRAQGVTVGKADYVPHIFPYLREASPA